MAVDYIIDYPCKVKEALPLNELIPMVKRRDYCRYILSIRLQDGESEEQALNSTIEFQMRRPDGVTTQTEKLSDALNVTKVLDGLEGQCRDCPASRGQDFGCYCVINYPISGKAEEWLIDMAKQALERGPPDSLLLDFILDKGLDGGSIPEMRAADSTYLELRKPMEVVVPDGPFKGRTVSTDQILAMFIDVGTMGRPHMKGLLQFSGGFSVLYREPACITGLLASRMVDESGTETWLMYNLPDGDMDDHSIKGLKQFLRAVFAAYALNNDILLDL
ncbi:MAG TPA: hypothetical protein VK436_15645 [Methanocella sp.]|nr:hypothetical protein [Methanocella sp.]